MNKKWIITLLLSAGFITSAVGCDQLNDQSDQTAVVVNETKHIENEKPAKITEDKESKPKKSNQNKEKEPVKEETKEQQPEPKKKSNAEIAKEVLNDQWSDGDERVEKLKDAGYDPEAVQIEVIKQSPKKAVASVDESEKETVHEETAKPSEKSPSSKPKTEKPKPTKKSNTEIAKEVIAGQWGSGADRTQRLTNAGYDARAIQSEINKSVKKPSVSKPAKNKKPASKPVAPSEPKPQTTNGFNFNGHHFGIASFSGSGQVPQNTNNVYQWTSLPSHYLVERISPAGRVIKQLGVGSELVINGVTYKVHTVRSGVPNDDNGWNVVTGTPNDISIQTCDTTKGANGMSDLTIWWANRK